MRMMELTLELNASTEFAKQAVVNDLGGSSYWSSLKNKCDTRN